MTRAVYVLAIALAWLGSLAAARADTRPRVAILGLEVATTVDEKTTDLAHQLTEGMRQRARLGSGPFAYAPGSERELIDEKLIKACETETPQCMALIGKDLSADMLVYGKLDREDKSYKLTLHLLDVGKKSKQNRINITIPLDGAATKAKATARSAYEELTGASAMGGLGTVEIEANIDEGTVYVDDSSSEVLVDGRAKLTLPEGRYRIAVEAPGKQRKEISVLVVADQTIAQSFELVAGSNRGEVGDRSNAVRTTSYVVAGAGAVGVLVWAYLWLDYTSQSAEIQAFHPSLPEGQDITDEHCYLVGNQDLVDQNGVFASTCNKEKWQFRIGVVGWTLVGVGAGLYIWDRYIRGDSRESRGRDVAVTPIVTETSAGAVLQMTW